MSQPLDVKRRFPGWSEQSPEQWRDATCRAVKDLKSQTDLSCVRAIGLSGQMHGATLLDKHHKPLRDAILWNDGRSALECVELESLEPEFITLGGNRVMPGFTAPKIQWVRKNEPELFEKIDKVLLPKDYLRFKMTGEFASDLSDSAGTLWLDIKKRDWSDNMLSACGLERKHMPELFEGCQITGYLKPELAKCYMLHTDE